MTRPWTPPGPVARAFYDTDAELAALMGPVGSGKTTVGLMRGVVRSYLQKPGPDGRRRAKFAVIRRLMKDLEKTTMQSWNRWFPRNMKGTTWHGAAGDPATHELTLRHPVDGGLVDLRVEFIALGDLRIEEALRGWEGTFAYADEADLLAPNALTFLLSRVGRYPAKAELGWSGVWATFNAPEVDSYCNLDFIEEPKPGHVLFRQPGGLEPGAENLENLPPGYYERLATTMPAYDARRFVHNIPGIGRDGEPVYPEFNDTVHIAPQPLQLLRGRDLIVGMDAGGTPAAGIWQRAADGQWRKLRELTTHEKQAGSITGPIRFGEALRDILDQLLRDESERPISDVRVRGVADPSAQWGADEANGESSWIDTVARVARIPVMPAATNDPTPREEAYRLPMTRFIDGRKPGLLICPSCRQTRIALMRDYKWPTIRGPGGTRRADKPAKNWASHMIEADQYALLDGSALHEVLARDRERVRTHHAPQVAVTDFNPFA